MTEETSHNDCTLAKILRPPGTSLAPSTLMGGGVRMWLAGFDNHDCEGDDFAQRNPTIDRPLSGALACRNVVRNPHGLFPQPPPRMTLRFPGAVLVGSAAGERR